MLHAAAKEAKEGGTEAALLSALPDGTLSESCLYPDLLSTAQASKDGVRVLTTGTPGVDRYLLQALDAKMEAARKWHRKTAGF